MVGIPKFSCHVARYTYPIESFDSYMRSKKILTCFTEYRYLFVWRKICLFEESKVQSSGKKYRLKVNSKKNAWI